MVVIIIVNWNGIEDTLECLESLARMEDGDFRIIVLDNGSSTSPSDAIERWAKEGLKSNPSHPIWQQQLASTRAHRATFQKIAPVDAWNADVFVTLVEIGWNSGFAHANNVGIKMALGVSEVSHVWLLNNDTIVQPDTLAELKATALSEPRYAIIGSTLIYYHHNDLVQGIGASFNRLSGRTKLIGNKVRYMDLVSQFEFVPKMDFVIGASMFVTREFIESAGLMDERYFLYFEELDWANSLRPGEKLGWSPRSIVYHKEGASIGSSSLSKSSTLSNYYLNRGLPLFYSKWYPQLLPVALLKTAFSISRFIIRGERVRAQAALRGAVSGLRAIIRRPGNDGTKKDPPHLS